MITELNFTAKSCSLEMASNGQLDVTVTDIDFDDILEAIGIEKAMAYWDLKQVQHGIDEDDYMERHY